MKLSQYPVTSDVAVRDMERAAEFYEGALGLTPGRSLPDGSRYYDCAGGTAIHVYPSPDSAGTSAATVLGWTVDDVETTVNELTAQGVSFEQYGEPLNTDARGIASMGDAQAAWFKDPDGNILCVSHGM